LALTTVPDPPELPLVPLPVVSTGALALTNGDPDVPVVVGVWDCTGALALTTVPDPPELPLVPLPVVSTGVLALTNGDPDVPGVAVEPLLALLALLAPLDDPAVAGAELWLLPPEAGALLPAGAPPEDWA
jgi:hypothetical protein